MQRSRVRVCFVCMGNICRSPSAEVVFRSLVESAGLADAVEVASAGTGGWHVGEAVDPRAAAVLVARGYEPRGHAARRFGRDWFDRYDLVVAMDRENERALRTSAPDRAAAAKVRLLRSYDPLSVAGADLEVPDPYYGGPTGFEDVLDLVERGCRGLLEEVSRAVAA